MAQGGKAQFWKGGMGQESRQIELESSLNVLPAVKEPHCSGWSRQASSVGVRYANKIGTARR